MNPVSRRLLNRRMFAERKQDPSLPKYFPPLYRLSRDGGIEAYDPMTGGWFQCGTTTCQNCSGSGIVMTSRTLICGTCKGTGVA